MLSQSNQNGIGGKKVSDVSFNSITSNNSISNGSTLNSLTLNDLTSNSLTSKDFYFPVSVDTEYQSVLNKPTIPISVQLLGEDKGEKLYLHPNAPIPDNKRHHDTFKSPFAPIDYFGWQWRDDDGKKTEFTALVDSHFFFSYKDIEFLFADSKFYRTVVLPKLQRFRRISHGWHNIKMPWQVFVACKDGKRRWCNLSLKLTDICAMQGAGGLKEYATNVGVKLTTKDTYTPDEKGKMLQMYLDNPTRFEDYALGDLPILEIKMKTINFYNEIAGLLGVEPRQTWGMSTGKIVASITSDWMAQKMSVSLKQFHAVTKTSGSKGFTNISRLTKNKDLVYLAMVDGGRAVRERAIVDTISCILNDIDIAGCYGNGLLNQKFAVGMPTLMHAPMKLGKFLSKYRSQMLPGLWYARIGWKDAPFAQDLLISKVEKQFTNWDNAISGKKGKNVYDASMVLTSNEVTHAALNHDLLQVLEHYFSNQEWGWLLENAVIETAAIYRKSDKRDKVTKKMLDGVTLSSSGSGLLDCSKEWVEVDLKELMSTLLTERGKHQKKTPMNTFLKLIINTIYGCTASEHFSTEGTGISNVVVGNNITARARCLAWCMAKGLHSFMTVTDGGVFDVNKVLKFKQTSSDLFERLNRDVFTTNDRHRFVEQVPLFGRVVNEDDMPKLMKEIDSTAWQHLKSQFVKLDIFSLEQFKFESKNWYTKLTLHSKVDYRLVGIDGNAEIALRGMRKVYNVEKKKKMPSQNAHDLFDAIEAGKSLKIVVEDTQLISQKDWKKDSRNLEILPHEEVTDIKTFYSHTPLATRYQDLNHYKKVMNSYERAKTTGDCSFVAMSAELN